MTTTQRWIQIPSARLAADENARLLRCEQSLLAGDRRLSAASGGEHLHDLLEAARVAERERRRRAAAALERRSAARPVLCKR